jgi:hypothetical protein
VIRFALVVTYTVLLFLALMYDGFFPVTENGRPLTYEPRARFWPGNAMDDWVTRSCGADAVNCMPFTSGDVWYGGHCLGKIPGDVTVRGAGGYYTADSGICLAAVHSGVISAESGGCFEARFTGPSSHYNASYANGVTSTEFGWFPKSVQLRAVKQGTRCVDARWASELVVIMGFIGLVVIWRVDPKWMNHVVVQWGYYYLGLRAARGSGNFWPTINSLCRKEFIIVPTCLLLFNLVGTPGFCPDPRRYPLEALVLFCGFYWAFIHLQDYEDGYGVTFTFTSDGLTSLSTGSIVALSFIGVLGVPLAVLQTLALWRAGLIPKYVLGLSALVLYLVVLALASEPGLFSFHLHHYFLGLFLCVCGRGGGRWYSTIIQAIGLGLFVHGVAVYDTDPFYDQVGWNGVGYSVGWQPGRVAEVPVFTRIEHFMEETPPRVWLEWSLPSRLIANWNCSDSIMNIVPGILVQNKAAPGQVTYNVARNGIMLPGAYYGSLNMTFPALSAKDPLVFTVSMTGQYDPTSSRIPVPYPMVNPMTMLPVQYHEEDATLCERINAIYGAQWADDASFWWKH